MFEDKFKYTHEEEVDLIEKNLVQLVYTTGKFDNLATTLPQTASIMNNYAVNDVSPDDIEKVLGLKRAFEYILKRDHPLNMSDIKEINKAVQNGKPDSGRIRNDDVLVPLTTETWAPPVPDKNKETKHIEGIIEGPEAATDKALSLNLYLSRWQLFMDGNKRTALVAANALMVDAGTGMLAIKDSKMHWYGSQLQRFYLSGRDQGLKQWLYDNAVVGTPSHKVKEIEKIRPKSPEKSYDL